MLDFLGNHSLGRIRTREEAVGFRPTLVVAPVLAILLTGNAAYAVPDQPTTGTTANSAHIGADICGTPLGTTTDSDGDHHHRFRLPNGLIEDQVVPASDFDPATAPADRIKKLALPARPSSASPGRSEWNQVALGVKRRKTPKPSCGKQGVRATFYTYNYGGYRAIAASGKAYSGAHSSYTAPAYYLSTCSSESMTQWVGVSDNNVLVQSGMYVTQYTGTVESGGFWEFVGGPWDTGHLMSVRASVPYYAGHRYYFSVEYVDRYDWAILVQDLDNGNTYSSTIYNSGAGGTSYIQPYGYFVSERLSYGSLMTQYMNHSDVRFRSATVHIYGETDARMSIQRPEEVVMISPGIGNARLANTDPLEEAGSNFTEHWARCGIVE